MDGASALSATEWEKYERLLSIAKMTNRAVSGDVVSRFTSHDDLDLSAAADLEAHARRVADEEGLEDEGDSGLLEAIKVLSKMSDEEKA